METQHHSPYVLFLDLDGVMADFDRGVKELFGVHPKDLEPKVMWPRLARTPGFYDSLPWIEDGRKLWEACRGAKPVILTGLPIGKWAEGQKRSWCTRELGPEVPVLTGFSRHKPRLARQWLEEHHRDREPTMVLVDDRDKIRSDWEDAGGIFIHHMSSAQSLAQLRKLKIID